MEKVKLVSVLLIILVMLFLAAWGAYAAFSELGFWKTAVMVMLIEFFFAARGSYLAAVAVRAYIEELRELRSELENSGNKERVKCGPLAIDLKFFGGGIASRALTAATVTALSGAALFFFGVVAGVAVIAVCVFALMVRFIYMMKRRIADAQTELEDYRLTFLRNDNGIITKEN